MADDNSKKYVSGDNLKYTLQQLKTKLDETYSTIEYVDEKVILDLSDSDVIDLIVCEDNRVLDIESDVFDSTAVFTANENMLCTVDKSDVLLNLATNDTITGENAIDNRLCVYTPAEVYSW